LRRLAAIEHVDADGVGRSAAQAAEIKISLDDLLPLWSSPSGSDRLFATGFVSFWAWQRKDSVSIDVLPPISRMLSDETISSYLQCLPPMPAVWECIEQQKEPVQQLYWKKAPVPWEIPRERLEYFVRNLIGADRADRAVEILCRHKKVITDDDAVLVFEALEALPDVDQAHIERNRNGLRHELQKLFEVLYKTSMNQLERLVRLEIFYHSIFEDDQRLYFQPKGLLVAIRDNPTLLIEMLRYCWKDDNGESAKPGDAQARALGEKVGRLLHALAELPGQSELCPMSEKTIAEWVTELVRLASECRHLTAVGLQLPHIIASGAWDSIEKWPSNEIAEAINVLASAIPETFPEHLSISLSNARGVHWVDPSGQSEKSQAESLRKRAEQLRKTCPPACRALQDIAKSLDSEGRNNIEQAKWER
jgi:hypothetical protein